MWRSIPHHPNDGLGSLSHHYEQKLCFVATMAGFGVRLMQRQSNELAGKITLTLRSTPVHNTLYSSPAQAGLITTGYFP
ncbi:Uncharacterised protein [Plesiomonas shigelloides]|nr:Uncharacterised protein [Plesiomonas shigelloides]